MLVRAPSVFILPPADTDLAVRTCRLRRKVSRSFGGVFHPDEALEEMRRTARRRLLSYVQAAANRLSRVGGETSRLDA